MIMRLLGNAMPWLLALLLGAAIFAGMQARQYAAERDAALVEVERAEQRAARLGEVMSWQRDQIRSLSSALAARDERLASDSTEINQRRDTARQLERDDDATGEWADQPVPAATREWLRNLGSDTGAGDPDPDSAELPAKAATGTQPPGEP